MKNKGLIITLIVILTILCVSIIGFMIYAITGNFKFKSLKNITIKDAKIKTIDKEYSDIINNIDIISDAGKINVVHSNNENIRVVVYSEKQKATSEVNENTLKIKVKNDDCNFFCFNSKTSKIILYVPEDYSGNFKIENDYGDITIGEFENSNVTVNDDYGDIKIKSVNTLTAKTDYGDIKVNYISKTFDLKTDCGDINIEEANIIEKSYINNDYGDIKIEKINNVYIDAKTDLGDVKVNNNNRMSNVILKIRNDCGDIKVN